MRRALICGVAAVFLVAAVAVGAGAWMFFRHPLAVYAWMNRRELTRVGLVKARADSPVGPQTYWYSPDDSRKASRARVAFLHGAGDQAGTWADAARALHPDYSLLVIDLPGHGDSAPASGPLPIATVLAGVSAVLDRETTDAPVTLVGHSLGAWIASLYAVAHPSRVSRLVLVNGGPLRGDRDDLTLMPANRAEAARILAQLTDPGSAQMPGFVLDDIVREARSGGIARLSMAAGTMGAHLLDGRLALLTTPVDLLWGESDRVMSPGYARRLASQLPAARLTMIPRCGHVPQQECGARFIAALKQVLAARPPARQAPRE